MARQIELSLRIHCPCCGYPTLGNAAHYEICELCDWEDDGQGDDNAAEVRGGPNGRYSLSEARANFRQYLVMYAPGEDMRILPDSERGLSTKRDLIAAFDRFARTGLTPDVLLDVSRSEKILEEELYRKIEKYNNGGGKQP